MPDEREDIDDQYDEADADALQRDPKIDEAKEFLLKFLSERPAKVFYLSQLEVLHEAEFFHWITSRALDELAKQGLIDSDPFVLKAKQIRGVVKSLGLIPDDDPAPLILRFYRARSFKARYWKRKARRIASLVAAYSRSSLTLGLGPHAEVMMDSALSSVGFVRRAKDVKEWNGKIWTLTDNNLDRVYERDGVAYGAEIKNKLGSIDRKELRMKMRIAEHLGLRPLFLLRWAPKNYIEEVRRRRGFTLVYKYQLYPHGFGGVAKMIRDELHLPVDSPATLAEKTARRFLDWHEIQRRVSVIWTYLENAFTGRFIEYVSWRKKEYLRIRPLRKKVTLDDPIAGNAANLPPDPVRTVRAGRQFLSALTPEELEQYLRENDLAAFLQKTTRVELMPEGIQDLAQTDDPIMGESDAPAPRRP